MSMQILDTDDQRTLYWERMVPHNVDPRIYVISGTEIWWRNRPTPEQLAALGDPDLTMDEGL